ncbi:unnamed protein product [Blepharisma stoltei]|uniref:Transmembrane protein n=1 Tax=Blepharisma stoltei TaxID=1481888 RepID=A0AAU9JYN5_9CILI|nr:unnamed protein product [Blepharisma stoltei]
MGDQTLLLPSATKDQEWFSYFFIFTIEFEYALESVFVNPYFNRLNCSIVFISVLWLLPSILSLGLQPLIQKYIYQDYLLITSHKKTLSYIFCSLALFGILMFISAGTISEWYFKGSILFNSKARDTSLVLGVIGYLLMGVSHNSLFDMFLGLSETEKLKTYITWGCVGRMCGFLLASIDCFEIYSLYMYYNVGDNMTLTYFFSAVLYLFSMCFAIPTLYAGRRESDNSFFVFPGFKFLLSVPKKMLLLMMCYFFTFGCNILISIYATSWVSNALITEKHKANEDRRLFDMGVSWGAFTLFLSGIVTLLIISLIPYVRKQNYLKDSYILAGAHLISAAALLSTYNIENFQWVFIIIPLCGLSIGANFLLPQCLLQEIQFQYGKICDKLSYPHRGDYCSTAYKTGSKLESLLRFLLDIPSEEDKIHHSIEQSKEWSKILNLTAIFAQTVMFGLAPYVIVFWLEGETVKWGMVTAGLSALIGGLLAFLL